MNLTQLKELIRCFVELGEQRGAFVALTIAGNGHCRALWQHYSEEFTLDQLNALLTPPKAPHVD